MSFYYEFIDFNSEIPIKTFIVGIREFDPHFHDEIELVFVIKGSIDISISNKNFRLNTNDFIIINSKEIHYFNKMDNGNVVLIIQINPNIPVMSHSNLASISIECNSISFNKSHILKAIDEIRDNLNCIISEVSKKEDHYELSVYSLILKILTIIFRNFPYYEIDDEGLKSGNENLNRINNIFQYVEQNYMHNISLHDAASLLHLNDYYFSHFFKKYVGLSFGKYLTKIRVEKAKNLMMSSDKSLTSIALECGFSSVKALHRAFKDIEGCPPSKYKESKIWEQKSNIGNDESSIKQYNDSTKSGARYVQYMSIIDDSALSTLGCGFPTSHEEKGTIYSERSEQAVDVVFNANDCGKVFNHYWKKLICAGRAAEGLREEWRNQLMEVQRELGFEYIRFHGVFHDDMMVYNEKNGVEIFNWQYLDSLFDFLLEVGLRPVLELGFMPDKLKSGDKTVFWWKGNVTPPRDYFKWSKLVKELVVHCINRYGKSEVLKWYFEVWNEPNHDDFWDGSKQDYFMLYKHTAEAIKAVDEKLKVGGPAVFQGHEGELSWLEDFLAFCENNTLPIDFVSYHHYPVGVAVDEGDEPLIICNDEDSTYLGLKRVRDVVARTSYKDVEIIISEWNSSFSSRDLVHDTMYKAPFVIQNILKCLGLVDALGWWVFTDIFEELPIDNRIFHGGFGLINIQGLKKPSYYGYWFLSRLGTEKIASGDCYFVTRKQDSIQILMWNYCHYNEEFAAGNRTRLTQYNRYEIFDEKRLHINLEVKGLNGKYRVREYVLDRDYGSVFDAWVKMGAPENLSKEEIDILKKKMGPEGHLYTIGNIEVFQKNIVIQPHGVHLIELCRIYE
jgi:xylan 1,4-beta-xylosidase